jgi:hypothetical protein
MAGDGWCDADAEEEAEVSTPGSSVRSAFVVTSGEKEVVEMDASSSDVVSALVAMASWSVSCWAPVCCRVTAKKEREASECEVSNGTLEKTLLVHFFPFF